MRACQRQGGGGGGVLISLKVKSEYVCIRALVYYKAWVNFGQSFAFIWQSL